MENIEDFFTVYKQSAWEKDIESMLGLYADDVVIFDLWEVGYQKGKSAWSLVLNEWLGSLGEEKVHVEFEMVSIQKNETVGFGSAIISYQAIGIDDVVIRSMKNRITLGFIREEDRWKVVHQHTSAPINEDLQATFDF